MPDPWNDRTWKELAEFSDADQPRERNTDSSVSAQYEDHIPPDGNWKHEDES